MVLARGFFWQRLGAEGPRNVRYFGVVGALVALVGVWGALVALVGRHRFGDRVGDRCRPKSLRDLENPDPKEVVIDEVAGQGIAFLFCPFAWPWLLAAFVLFRFFDILKPWPVGWIDRNWHGGWGIMADDLVAGLYALGCLQGAHYLIQVL